MKITQNTKQFSLTPFARPNFFYSSGRKHISFSTPIPSQYVLSKEKDILFHIVPANIYDLQNFTTYISNGLVKDLLYTVYVKVRYDENNFFMAGNQFGFDFTSSDSISHLQENIIARLEEYFLDYNLTEDQIVYIQLRFKKLDKKLLQEFSSSNIKEIITTSTPSETLSLKGLISIPVSTHSDSLGKPLDINIKDGFITNVFFSLNNEKVDFISRLQSSSLHSHTKGKIAIDYTHHFDPSYTFYLLKDKVFYILCIKYHSNGSIEKYRYGLNGVLISSVIDKPQDGVVLRTSGSKELVLQDNEIVSYKQNISLKPLAKPKTEISYIRNPNIGVIDLETFKNDEGINKVYAAGFKTNLANDSVLYYIDEASLDSNEVILRLINELLRPKYNNTHFYCHNLSGYDIVFILNTLYDYNENNEDKYSISAVLRKDKIIKVSISKAKHKLVILDSYCLLTKTLAQLGKDFQVTVQKSIFPYQFGRERNLFYKGVIPSYSYYEGITKEEYLDISNDFASNL